MRLTSRLPARLARLDDLQGVHRVFGDRGRALIQGNIELWLLFDAAADEGQNFVEAAQPQPAVHRDSMH